MDRVSAVTFAVGGPTFLFVLAVAVSSRIYDPSAGATGTPRAALGLPGADVLAPEDPEEVEEAALEEEAPAEEPPVDEVAADEAPVDEAPAEVASADEAEADAPLPVDEVAATDPADGEAEAAPMDTAEADEAAASETVAMAAPEDGTTGDADVVAAEEAAEGVDTDMDAPSVDLAALVAAGDARAGSRIWRQCSACHVADQAQNRVGPHLVGVLCREIAAIEDFRYSNAMGEMEGVWTAEEMSAWLANPADYAPGTKMTYRGLSDAEDRTNILAYLADLQLNGAGN